MFLRSFFCALFESPNSPYHPSSAAILSMRHPRVTIFSGSLLALALMSFLSSLLGAIVPTLLPKRWTTVAAAVLFFFFGGRMLMEGIEMESGDKGREKMEEEMREVQKEVEEAEEEIAGGGAGAFPLTDLEEGRMGNLQGDGEVARSRSGSPAHTGGGGGGGGAGPRHRSRRSSLSLPMSKADAVSSFKDGAKNLCSLFFSPIFVQAFVLTFLAEWGDRSQIATIALAAAHVRPFPFFSFPSCPIPLVLIWFTVYYPLQNVWLVTIGTTLGHSVCTLIAVIGGRWVSKHISIKHGTA